MSELDGSLHASRPTAGTTRFAVLRNEVGRDVTEIATSSEQPVRSEAVTKGFEVAMTNWLNAPTHAS